MGKNQEVEVKTEGRSGQTRETGVTWRVVKELYNENIRRKGRDITRVVSGQKEEEEEGGDLSPVYRREALLEDLISSPLTTGIL